MNTVASAENVQWREEEPYLENLQTNKFMRRHWEVYGIFQANGNIF